METVMSTLGDVSAITSTSGDNIDIAEESPETAVSEISPSKLSDDSASLQLAKISVTQDSNLSTTPLKREDSGSMLTRSFSSVKV